jgi:2-polyprenyl-3-methyl-5-hydroxy-6-metoxy-1,4-benzoquinol methylase
VTDRARENHYSYTLYADPETARSFDDRRFGGPIGALVAENQAQLLAAFIGPLTGRRILDVGTGTGRAALLLARAGARVTGVDASEPMLSVARERAAQAGLALTFLAGDAHALTFPDRAFEVAVSLRVIMHTPRWRDCIGELCRVSDDLVILDYPARTSLAALQSWLRGLAHRVGVRTEPYRVFSHREIRGALEASGFRVRAMDRLFVLPIALHKLIGSRRVTLAVEGLLDRLGLRRRFGSPVTLVAERCVRS